MYTGLVYPVTVKVAEFAIAEMATSAFGLLRTKNQYDPPSTSETKTSAMIITIIPDEFP
jgi:hypothetical protein